MSIELETELQGKKITTLSCLACEYSADETSILQI